MRPYLSDRHTFKLHLARQSPRGRTFEAPDRSPNSGLDNLARRQRANPKATPNAAPSPRRRASEGLAAYSTGSPRTLASPRRLAVGTLSDRSGRPLIPRLRSTHSPSAHALDGALGARSRLQFDHDLGNGSGTNLGRVHLSLNDYLIKPTSHMSTLT